MTQKEIEIINAINCNGLDNMYWAMLNQAVAKVRGWELPVNVKVRKSKTVL